ncbi:MAG TPA: sugar phosphate isomerase/epimerase [Spongiibacteraceae bacterium]|jgi:sugar phosphate isomerase/epimerase
MNFKRREFLATAAGIAGATMMMSRKLLADPLGLPIGIQLYTIADELKKDLHGTLRAVAKMGYRTVETAFMPVPAKELRAALDECGLECVSTHQPLSTLLANSAHAIEDAHTLGAKYIICSVPWVTDVTRFKPPKAGETMAQAFMALMHSFTLDDWKWNAEKFNKFGEQFQHEGLQFGYHNHDFEFDKSGDETYFDALLRMTDPKLVVMEMDCGWVTSAGFDPVDLLHKYAGRFRLLHVKDVQRKSSGAQTGMDPAEVGKGIIDWPRVFRAAKEQGVAGYFVEQEPPFTRPPLEEINASYQYLHSLTI